MSKTEIFVHIPKTGGTTLINIAVRQHWPWQIYLASQRNGSMKENVDRSLKIRRIKLVLGHLPYQMAGSPSDKFSYITFLRDPVSVVISYYKHICREGTHFQHGATESMSLREYLLSDLYAPNIQTRYLSTFFIDAMEQEKFRKRSLTRGDFEFAKNTLIHGLDAFGITERFDESMLYFMYKLRWRGCYYKPQRVSLNSHSVSSEDVELIRSLNSFDCSLYEKANELFTERCKDINNFDSKLKEYKLKNNYLGSMFTQYGRAVKKCAKLNSHFRGRK